MEMEKELRRRIAQEGFEISFNPPGDGNCFYRAAAFQLGLQSEILHKRIFDYLEGHQFDNQGNDHLAFLCEVDLGGQKVPTSWSAALKILQKNYANSVVISALADFIHYKIIIITVHGDDNYVKVVEPQSGASIGTLYFGHSGYHYVALKPKQQKISSYAAAVKSSSSIPKVIPKIKVKDCSPHETNKVTSIMAESDIGSEAKLDFDNDNLRARAEVYNNKGNNEYRRKEFSSAVYFYTEGLKVNCKDDELNAKLYSNRASAYFCLGNYQETLNDAKAAVKLEPTLIKAIEKGVNACVELHLYEEAISWCDKGLAIKSNNKILLDLRSKSVDEANRQQMKSKAENETVKVQISSYAAAVKSSSSIPKVIPKIKVEDCSPHETNKISSYAAAVKSSSSIPKVITKIKVEDCSPHETNKVTSIMAESDVTAASEAKLDFDNDNLRAIAEVYNNEGDDEYRRKEFSNAVYFYTEGIKVNCKDDELNARLYSNRAAAYFCLGNYQETLNDAKAAVKLEPTFIKAIEKGANACVELHLYEEAISWCDKGLAIKSNNKILLDLRSKCVLDEANRMKSKAENETVKVQKSTDNADLHKSAGDETGQGSAYIKAATTCDTHAELKQEIDHHEHHLKIFKEAGDRSNEGIEYCKLGIIYKQLGDHKRAVDCYERCLDIATEMDDRIGQGMAYCNLGNAYRGLGCFNKAIEYLELSIKNAKDMRDKAREGIRNGNLGNVYHSLRDFKTAIHHHNLSLEIAKEMGDRAGEVRAYDSLGNDYHGVEDYKRAIEYYELSLKIAIEIGDREGELRAYRNLGNDYENLQDFRKAIHYHELCLKIAKEVGNRTSEEEECVYLGDLYRSLGDYEKAIECYERALNIAKEMEDRETSKRKSVLQIKAYCGLGRTHFNLHCFNKAIECLEISLEIAIEVGDRVNEGTCYSVLGSVYESVGDLKKAIEYRICHLNIVRQMGNRAEEGHAYCHLGTSFSLYGYDKQAISCHEISLNIAKHEGNRTGEGLSHLFLGNSYFILGVFLEAIHHHEIHLKIAKEMGLRNEEAIAYANLGKDYCKLGWSMQRKEDFIKAKEYGELLLKLATDAGDNTKQLIAYECLGFAYAEIGDFDKSLKYFELFLKLAKEMEERNSEADAYFGLGRIYWSLGSLREAADCFQSSVDIRNDMWVSTPLLKDEWKIHFWHEKRDAHTQLWRVLLKQGEAVKALFAAEQGRAQALKDLMLSQYGLERSCLGSLPAEETIYDIISCLRSTAVFIAVWDEIVFFWVCQKGKYFKLRKKQIPWDVNTYFELMKGRADKEINPRAGLRCEDRSLDQLDCSLDKLRGVKLLHEMSDETLRHSSNLKTEPLDKLRGVKLPHERFDQSQRHSSNHKTAEPPLRALYDALISPIADLVDGNEVIVVTEGLSCLFPFAAFEDTNSKFLCESFRIRMLPSLSSLNMIANCLPEYHRNTGALLVGDPYVQDIPTKDKDPMPQLPCARQEVEMIGKILHTEPLTGRDATKKEVLKRLSRVALIHIAAHGRIETGEIALAPNPSRPSQIPDEEDFRLTMKDVLNAKLRARLVVLSCCHSGRGKIKAEGVVGIARAFLGAGARSVLVSLWAIDDAATMKFMSIFYQHLVSGASASEALNRAMNSMIESKAPIKHWAPFVLIGDDVTLEFGGIS